MSARDKLNDAHVNVAVIVGGAIGIVTGSITVFIAATVLIIVVDLYTGELRPFRKPRQRD